MIIINVLKLYYDPTTRQELFCYNYMFYLLSISLSLLVYKHGQTNRASSNKVNRKKFLSLIQSLYQIHQLFTIESLLKLFSQTDLQTQDGLKFLGTWTCRPNRRAERFFGPLSKSYSQCESLLCGSRDIFGLKTNLYLIIMNLRHNTLKLTQIMPPLTKLNMIKQLQIQFKTIQTRELKYNFLFCFRFDHFYGIFVLLSLFFNTITFIPSLLRSRFSFII